MWVAREARADRMSEWDKMMRASCSFGFADAEASQAATVAFEMEPSSEVGTTDAGRTSRESRFSSQAAATVFGLEAEEPMNGTYLTSGIYLSGVDRDRLNQIKMLVPAALVAGLLAAGFQFYVKPVLTIAGYNRVPQPVGNDNCHTVPELKACESMPLFSACCPDTDPPQSLLYTSPQAQFTWLAQHKQAAPSGLQPMIV